LLRSYEPRDFPALHRLDVACFPLGIAYSKTTLRYFLTIPSADCVVALVDDKIAGFIVSQENAPLAHIITLDVSEAHRRMGGLRFGATRRVWGQLFPAVLEQKVTGVEARRSWRELVRRFGDPAPGPAPDGMRTPLTPAQTRDVPDWEWHKAGVDHAKLCCEASCAANPSSISPSLR